MKITSRIIASCSVVATLLLSSAFTLANTLDPVSTEEFNRAMLLVAPQSALQSRGLASNNEAAAAQAAPNTEFLGVKAHRFEKSELNKGFRWADTQVYDYSTDELITTVIDLESNEIITVQRNKEMQPPISANELERAMHIIFEDDEELSILKSEFQQITGKTLTKKEQINYKAFTFFADSMPGVVNSASKVCGIQRCAQIMLYTDERITLVSSPIVNLSAGLISQRIGY